MNDNKNLYLNAFHRKNSELVMKSLKKQRIYSREEKIAQIQSLHAQSENAKRNAKKDNLSEKE